MKITKLSKLLKNEKKAIKYLKNEKIITEKAKCKKCRRFCQLNIKEKAYRCYKNECGFKTNLLNHEIMKGTHLKLHKILWIWYLYSIKTPIQGIIAALGVSSVTVCKWTKKLRYILAEKVKKTFEKIGGQDIIVEVDETKMGKRKYNRGHKVEGVWCIVGIERTTRKRFFAIDVEKRDTETIKAVFEKYIEQGSIIYTDGWRAYTKVCEDLGYQHDTVNHTLHFKDPVTNVHTNTVEGKNNGLKLGIPVRNRTKKDIKGYLHYLVFKKQNENNFWNSILMCLKDYFK